MVGFLFQAITNKQVVCFLYRGMRRYVTPLRIDADSSGSILVGFEHGSPMARKYHVGEMIGLAVVEDPTIPEAQRFTPWIEEEVEKPLSEEEKLRASASKH